MAERICFNAKVQRPGVCNAIENLLVHGEVAAAFLPRLVGALAAAGVELRGCPERRAHRCPTVDARHRGRLGAPSTST